MKVKTKDIAEALYESLYSKKSEGDSTGDKAKTEIIFRNTFSLLEKNKLLSKGKEFIQAFQDVVDQKEERIRATITTREKISEKDLQSIENKLKIKYKAKEVVIENIEDEKVIGGIKIQVGEEITDATVGTHLKKLRESLLTA